MASSRRFKLLAHTPTCKSGSIELMASTTNSSGPLAQSVEQDTLNVKVVGPTPTWPTNFKLKNYELIEHTADIGIRVKGDDLKELFKNAALAMFEIMAEAKKQKVIKKEIKIKLKADNLEELFIDWLNELLFLSATKELIFSEFTITKLDKNNLEATAMGEDIGNFGVNAEVKAATYHQLKLQQLKDGWQAEIIFDV